MENFAMQGMMQENEALKKALRRADTVSSETQAKQQAALEKLQEEISRTSKLLKKARSQLEAARAEKDARSQLEAARAEEDARSQELEVENARLQQLLEKARSQVLEARCETSWKYDVEHGLEGRFQNLEVENARLQQLLEKARSQLEAARAEKDARSQKLADENDRLHKECSQKLKTARAWRSCAQEMADKNAYFYQLLKEEMESSQELADENARLQQLLKEEKEHSQKLEARCEAALAKEKAHSEAALAKEKALSEAALAKEKALSEAALAKKTARSQKPEAARAEEDEDDEDGVDPLPFSRTWPHGEKGIYFAWYRNQDRWGDGHSIIAAIRAQTKTEAKKIMQDNYRCKPERELYSWFVIQDVTMFFAGFSSEECLSIGPYSEGYRQ